jgi:hypothetical protein
MGHCKHQWTERTDVLRDVFRATVEHLENRFWVCSLCLRIAEVRPEQDTEKDRQDAA